MLDDVRAGRVRTVIIKDQSRIGRDVLEVGLLKRTFEEHDVRFIAANDGLDSANGFDIMSIFRDVINEYYVADASKKIRAVKRSNALAGKCGNRPPYGYRSVPGNFNEWEIDEEAAQYVREIFNQVIVGFGPYVIAKDLSARGIYAPYAHLKRTKGEEIPQKFRTSWSAYTVSQICDNKAYIGCLVAQKVTSASYKNKKRINRPEDEWVITENHHPPIVDIETFELVKKYRANRRRFTHVGELSILSGLLWCADCGSKLSLHSTRESKYQYFTCCNYNNGLNKYAKVCSRHSMRRDIIESLVLERLQQISTFACENKDLFVEQVQKLTHRNSAEIIKTKAKELTNAESRIVELNNIIKKTYEDNMSGKLNDDLFAKFQEDYSNEHAMLTKKKVEIEAGIKTLKDKMSNVQSFIELVEKHGRITELTADIARRLIDRIIVHESYAQVPSEKLPDGDFRKKYTKKVQIILNCIGEFIPE